MKYLLPILLLLLTLSCEEKLPEQPDKSINVEEVKAFFQNTILPQSKARSDQSVNVLWEMAEYHNISIGDALLFPLEDDRFVFFDSASTFSHLPASLTSYAFAYKLDDSIHFEVVKLIPYVKSKGFTGALIVENWEGEKLRYFEYEKGRLLGEYEIQDSDNERGRTDEFVYTCTTTIYYTCWGEIPEDCRETARETTCVLKEVRVIAGPGTNGEDYGGGGSSTGDEMCKHPFLDDEYYPCDVCPNGYELWNGGCHPKCNQGFIRDDFGNCVPRDQPCESDPLVNMEISTYNSGKNANRYGCVRVDPDYNCGGEEGRRRHAGIDLQADIGTPVFSVSDGTVFATASNNPTFGNYIIIKSNKLYYLYAHLKEKPNKSGSVYVGTLLGYSGESATVGEPHLHLEVREQQTSESYNSMKKLNIENYLSTKFDSNGETIGNYDCS